MSRQLLALTEPRTREPRGLRRAGGGGGKVETPWGKRCCAIFLLVWSSQRGWLLGFTESLWKRDTRGPVRRVQDTSAGSGISWEIPAGSECRGKAEKEQTKGGKGHVIDRVTAGGRWLELEQAGDLTGWGFPAEHPAKVHLEQAHQSRLITHPLAVVLVPSLPCAWAERGLMTRAFSLRDIDVATVIRARTLTR